MQKFAYIDGPIIACSTSIASNAALAVIRISGIENLQQLKGILQAEVIHKLTQEPRKVLQVKLYDGNNNILDSITCAYFKSPASYTGENVLEIFAHGNTVNIQRILRIFRKNTQIRLASPGEFTYRALKNKKMTLTQVEGLDLLLNAKSDFVLDQGQKALQGELQTEFQGLYDDFLKLKSASEILIDFAEDVGDEEAYAFFDQAMALLEKRISSLHRRTKGPLASLLSPDVVIAGKANAGKSTLFNALLMNNRSIVSEEAGTTRDYISENYTVGSHSFRLIDTAGVRSTQNKIESEGVKRSLSLVKEAFYKILVINPFDENFGSDLDQKELAKITFDLVIFSHADLSGFAEKKKQFSEENFLIKFKKSIDISLLGPIGPSISEKEISSGPIGPKAKKTAFKEIECLLQEKLLSYLNEDPILVERQRYHINEIFNNFNMLYDLVKTTPDVAIIAQEVSVLGNSISELAGIITPDQVLTSIFNNFCIGK